MRYGIRSAITAMLLSLWACGIARASSAEDFSLHSYLYSVNYENDEVFQKDSCQWKAGQLVQLGSLFYDVFPPTAVKIVEVQGDDIALPTPLLIHILTEGRFGSSAHPITVGSAIAGRIRLRNGNCLQFNVLVDPAVRRVSSIDTRMGAMTVPDLPEECRALALSVKVGMTRAEVEKSMSHDGGFAGPYLDDPYVFRNSACGFWGEVLKVRIAFKHAGMSDDVYRLRKWTVPPESPTDIVMRISPEFMEKPHFD